MRTIPPSSLARLNRYLADYRPQLKKAFKAIQILESPNADEESFVIQYCRTTLYADLGAERPISAERGSLRLVVETKSFVGASKIQDLKEALGQYDIYRYLFEVPHYLVSVCLTTKTMMIHPSGEGVGDVRCGSRSAPSLRISFAMASSVDLGRLPIMIPNQFDLPSQSSPFPSSR